MIVVGSGANRFEVNVKQGLWMGADTFDNAPASIDFEGNALFSSVTIKTSEGDILIDSNSSTNDFIHVINSSLNTATDEILGNFTFGPSGAITIQTDANNGLWISPTGILAKKAGVTTLAIESDGDVTMKGTLLAGSVVACDIAGVNVYSSSNSNRVAMRNGDYFQVIVGGAESGRIYGDALGDIYIQGTDDIQFRAGGASRCTITTGSLKPMADRGYDLGADGTKFNRVYSRYFNGGASGTQGWDFSSGYAKDTNQSTLGFITAIQIRRSGGDMVIDAKYREILVDGGIVTGVCSETGWIQLDTASVID